MLMDFLRLRLTFSVLMLTVFCAVSPCAERSFPSLEPPSVPGAGEASPAPRTLMQAALVFSGTENGSDGWEMVMEEYDALSATVRSEAYQELGERERGEAILTLMYGKVLDRYSLNQSSVEVMFRDGTYNCVSSSVLYACLAQEAGLAVLPQQTPTHAFCTLSIDGSLVDVETTNPYGFNPGEKKSVSDDSGRYAVVPARTYRSRVQCSLPMLVSLIAQNRASMAYDKKDYRSPVALMHGRVPFLAAAPAGEYADALEGFLTACGNYAVSLQRAKDYEGALLWLGSVREAGTAYWSPELQETYGNSLHNAVAELLNAGDWESAETLLGQYGGGADEKRLSQLSALIESKRIERTALSMEPDEAIAFLSRESELQRSADPGVQSTVLRMLEYEWQQKIISVERSGDHLAASALADRALSDFPKSQALQRLRRTCLDNYAVDVHNRYAGLANAGRYDEAQAVLEEGLSAYPESSSLKRDLRTLAAMRSRR